MTGKMPDTMRTQAYASEANRRASMNCNPWNDPLYQWAMANAYVPPKQPTNPIGIPLIKPVEWK